MCVCKLGARQPSGILDTGFSWLSLEMVLIVHVGTQSSDLIEFIKINPLV